MFLSSNPPPIHSRPVLATAYCDRGFTRLQTPTRSGVIAVDPSLIRLGSRVKLLFQPRIQRIKELHNLVKDISNTIFRAEDTGNSIRGARIDIWMPSCADAMSWGTQTVVAVWGDRIPHGGLVPVPRRAKHLVRSLRAAFWAHRTRALASNPTVPTRSEASFENRVGYASTVVWQTGPEIQAVTPSRTA
jgi:3D (Asp-Asp-Asp) domain-containing protein